MTRSLALTAALWATTFAAAAPDPTDTKLLTQPAAGPGGKIAFVYADDLWVADADGTGVRRLTSYIGTEGNPVFSPDGETIAFTGEYDGNTDVYLIPAAGGEPKRLTWHPGRDTVRGFTPDGKSVLFISQREVFTRRYSQFFTVPVGGGQVKKLPIPNGHKGTYSPDGGRFAYTPLSERFTQWKNYRGGTHARIWVMNFDGLGVEQIPQPEGRCNDTDPYWADPHTVLFRSDRNGEFNLFAFDTDSKEVTQVTTHADFPVLGVSLGGGQIVYEQAGYLHRIKLPMGGQPTTPTKLTIGVPADLPERRARYVDGEDYVRAAAVSPSGKRAVLEVRGEIVTVPADKGEPRNLTLTQGVHERDPSWSPDGKTVAYFSDAGGEYHLVLEPQDGKGEPRSIQLKGSGFYRSPIWSPDSEKILYADNGMSLFILDVESGDITPVVESADYGLGGSYSLSSWSADSKWVTYAQESASQISRVYVYSLGQKKSFPITDGLSETVSPVFDKNGKYLYFLGSTDTGMAKHGFSQSAGEMRRPRWSIYLAVLQDDEPSPFRPESDEEETGEEKKGEDKDKKKDDKKEKKSKALKIDFDGIGQRIIAVPVPSGNYGGLETGRPGQLYYVKRPEQRGGRSELRRYDVSKRKDGVVKLSVRSYRLTPDGKKVFYAAGRGEWRISPVDGKSDGDKLDLGAIEIKIDPAREWPQIFHEAWRINRDFFYAPNFHGADWEAMHDKYRPFVDHCADREDLNRVIQWMCSELAVGHHRGGGGDRLYDTDRVPGGLLGADYEIADGRYRFKKVYGGLNWNPGMRAPLTEPGVNVKAGEYLLKVRGKDVKPPENLYKFFENTSGKQIEITVGPNADGADSRTVVVRPVGSESSLRNRAWVEGNLKKVEEATGGKVAYVYVPDTAGNGRTYFKRYFFPQIDKQAMIIDERFNSGGQIADYYIDLMRRPFLSYWAPRYGADWRTPSAAIHGPKVMLINETAGSGGDMLPWMFRKLKLGTIVGKRTWGGLVGISGYPPLMDSGRITAPNFAIWDPKKGWVVENEGVPPDVAVEQLPADVMAGRDPQLEKAIEIVMKQLKENPPAEHKRPPFPVRAAKSARR